MKACILTPWSGSGSEQEPLHPLVLQMLQGAWSFRDVTRQPIENLIPDPNLFAIEIDAEESDLEAIEKDPRFWIIWLS